jgi:hypothetical protein
MSGFTIIPNKFNFITFAIPVRFVQLFNKKMFIRRRSERRVCREKQEIFDRVAGGFCRKCRSMKPKAFRGGQKKSENEELLTTES